VVAGFIGHDLVTFPLYYLAPDGIGSPTGEGGDLFQFCSDIQAKYGVPAIVARFFFSATLGLGLCTGLEIVHHALALMGIGSGVYISEEWPKILNRPWTASSVSELWGKKYHQVSSLRHKVDQALKSLAGYTSELEVFGSSSELRLGRMFSLWQLDLSTSSLIGLNSPSSTSSPPWFIPSFISQVDKHSVSSPSSTFSSASQRDPFSSDSSFESPVDVLAVLGVRYGPGHGCFG